MIDVRDGACCEMVRFAGSRAVWRAIDRFLCRASGFPGGLRNRMHFTGMVQTGGQAARPNKPGGDTVRRTCTAFGNLRSAISVLLKPLTAATKTLAGSRETGELAGKGECGT